MNNVLEHPTLKKRRKAEAHGRLSKDECSDENCQHPAHRSSSEEASPASIYKSGISKSPMMKKWQPPSIQQKLQREADRVGQNTAIREFLTEILPEKSPLIDNPLFIKAVQMRMAEDE